METAWRSDLFKTLMHRTVAIAQGTRAQREAIIAGSYQFVIINFDGVKVVTDALSKGGFDLIIVDEANAIKNVQTDRWKSLAALVTPSTRLWMMTGTPASQSPLDAYGLAKLVNPDAVPKYFGAFRDRVMLKMSQYRWVPRTDAQAVVHQVLQPAIRFTKAECLDLPEMTYVNREVVLTKQQQKFYNLMKNRMVMEAAGEEITAVNAAVNLSKLLQISCGAVYSDTKEVVEFDIKNRYAVLKEVIDEANQKVLVFVPFKHAIDLITAKLREDGISCEVISGNVSAVRRTEIFKQFQETPEPRVLVIQPQSAAHGVTLTAADTVVWWGPTSSLETYAQANARVHRAGQRHPSVVIRLMGSNAEKHVYTMLDTKNDVHTQIVDLYKQLLD
jgi:SNF2 family DNA or RNA helicase